MDFTLYQGHAVTVLLVFSYNRSLLTKSRPCVSNFFLNPENQFYMTEIAELLMHKKLISSAQ